MVHFFTEQRKFQLLFFNLYIFLFVEGLWLDSIIHFEQGEDETLKGFEIGGITEPYAIYVSVSTMYLILDCQKKSYLL